MKKSKEVLRGTRGLMSVALMLVLYGIAAGCMRSKPSRFYTLREVLPESANIDTAKAVMGKVVLGVGPISVPSYLDRTKIVTRVDTAEVKVAEYSRWAGSVPDRIEDIIEENLTKLCPAVEVRKYTFRTRSTLTHYVQIDLTDLIADADGKVVLNARYVIFSIDNKVKPVRKEVSLHKQVKTGDYNGMVFAMSELLGEMCMDIAESVNVIK